MNDDRYRSRKWRAFVVGLSILVALAVALFVRGDPIEAWLGPWLMAFAGVIAIYSGANAAQHVGTSQERAR